jgi:ribonuclease P protein component
VLKKEERISSKKEFAEVKEKGDLISTPLLSVVWMKNAEGKKFAAIISKKISKKAVERNQIRRRLMEAVRLNKEIFPEGFRGIFLVKKNILDKKEMEIAECLKKLFNPPIR